MFFGILASSAQRGEPTTPKADLSDTFNSNGSDEPFYGFDSDSLTRGDIDLAYSG